jgi:outer membrane murein-binding lipoprotein Lpp
MKAFTLLLAVVLALALVRAQDMPKDPKAGNPKDDGLMAMDVEADKDVAVPSPGKGEMEAVEVADNEAVEVADDQTVEVADNEAVELPADLNVMDIDQVKDFLANVEQSQYHGSLSTVVQALNSVVKQLTAEIDASKARMDAAKRNADALRAQAASALGTFQAMERDYNSLKTKHTEELKTIESIRDMLNKLGGEEIKKQHLYTAHHKRQEARHMWAGGCTSHGNGGGWNQYCLNSARINRAEGAFSVRSDGYIFAHTTGYYRIVFQAIQHGVQGAADCGIQVNNNWVHYQIERNTISWTAQVMDRTLYVPKGGHIRVLCHRPENNGYAFHAVSSNHSNLEVHFNPATGDRAVSFGCNAHARGGWSRLCGNVVTPQFARSNQFMSVDGNGITTVKKTGYYRVLAQGSMHGTQYRHIRILINGGQRGIVYDFTSWATWKYLSIDRTVHMSAGQRIEFQFWSNSGNPYAFHASGVSAGHPLYNSGYVEFAGEAPAFASATCSGHGQSGGWARLCLNTSIRHLAGAGVTRRDDGHFCPQSPGFFFINAWVLWHARFGYFQLQRAGSTVSYLHQGHHRGCAWRTARIKMTVQASTNQCFSVFSHVAHCTLYNYHAGNDAGTRYSSMELYRL